MAEPTVAATPSAAADAAHPSPLRAPARPAAEFKGLSHPALRLVLNDADAASVLAALELLLGDGDAFEWQPVVLDASRVSECETLDLTALVERLGAARLHPVALAGAHSALRAQADALRLGWLAPLPTRRGREEPAARTDAASTPGGPDVQDAATPQAGDVSTPPSRDDGPTAAATAQDPNGPQDFEAATDDAPHADAPHADVPDSAPAAPAPGTDTPPADASAPATVAPAPSPGAMVIERPVRSGQQVYARDRDLVVIGDVSPGAEVIADGHVHVYGTLAGRAIAGARGRRDASIFALQMRAELVALCGIYRTFEDGPPASQAARPVRISLEANADTLSMRSL